MIDRVDETTDIVYRLNCHLKRRIDCICETVMLLLNEILMYVESLFIVVTCLIFSIVATVVLTHVISGILWSRADLLLFRAPSFFTMVALALGVGTLATFLPVYLAAKKKPAESIRAL